MVKASPLRRNLIAGVVYTASSFFCFSGVLLAQPVNQPSQAFSLPYSDVTSEQKFNFYLGKALFEKFWIPAPSSTTASDGLGPLFNARSCHSCHLNNGRGHAPSDNQLGSQVPSFFIRLSSRIETVDQKDKQVMWRDHPVYGNQFQTSAVTGLKSEGDFIVHYQTQDVLLNDGKSVTLRRPTYEWTQLNYGEFGENTRFSGRVSPPLIGMGLLDAVDAETLLEMADPEDKDGDGISGRVNRVLDAGGQPGAIGRFGWKAGAASLSQQNQGAFNGDIGLSTPLHPNASGECTKNQPLCLQAPNGNSAHMENLEANGTMTDLVDLYVALSAPPAMRNVGTEAFMEGKRWFDALNCGGCHVPKLKTGNDNPFAVLRNRTFYPFTDLLLHDMGAGLADQRNEHDANGQEWRTPPLWGIGLSETVSGRKGFLHDGRAQTIEEAILWHGGEAQPSQTGYRSLSALQRDQLLYFLKSL